MEPVTASGPPTGERVLGSLLASAVGDALGAPYEFFSREKALPLLGSDPWIDDLHEPAHAVVNPHGIWGPHAGRGCGTDDTRYNHLFLDVAASVGSVPSAADLAAEVIRRFERPDDYYPQRHVKQVRDWLSAWQSVCHGFLGETDPGRPEVPADVLATMGLSLDYPALTGLLLLASVGLAFPGRAEDAYRAAYRLAFFYIGYAKDCTALLAALVAAFAALGGPSPAARAEVVRSILARNPYSLGGPFCRRTPIAHLQFAVDTAVANGDRPRHLVQELALHFVAFHPFDPIEVLSVAVAAVVAGDDPATALCIAANHRSLATDGSFASFRDIDCTAYVAGAMAGALWGAQAVPVTWADAVRRTTRAEYGIEIDTQAERFCSRVLGDTG